MISKKIKAIVAACCCLLLASCNSGGSNSSENSLANSDTYQGSILTGNGQKIYSWSCFLLHGKKLSNFDIPIPLLAYNVKSLSSEASISVDSLKLSDITDVELFFGSKKIETYQVSWKLDWVCNGPGSSNSMNSYILHLILSGDAEAFSSLVIHFGKNSLKLNAKAFFPDLDEDPLKLANDFLGEKFSFRYLNTSCYPMYSTYSSGDISSNYYLDLSSSSKSNFTYDFSSERSSGYYSQNSFLYNHLFDTALGANNEPVTKYSLADNSLVYNVPQVLTSYSTYDNMFGAAYTDKAIFSNNIGCIKLGTKLIYSIYDQGKEIDLTSTKELSDYYRNILCTYQKLYSNSIKDNFTSVL